LSAQRSCGNIRKRDLGIGVVKEKHVGFPVQEKVLREESKPRAYRVLMTFLGGNR